MLWLGIALGLLGAYVCGLGWGGNGSKKEQLFFFGFVLLVIPGGYLTFREGGLIVGVLYLLIVSGLMKSFAESFARKYGGRL